MKTGKISFKNKNILVTGGTGFIGSHLVEELVKMNANIVVPFIEIHKKSLFKLERLSKKTVMKPVDITDKKKLFNLIKKNNIDYVFHLAAQTTVRRAYDDPFETLNTNIIGTVNLLEAVRLIPGVKGIIVASSDKAYGKTKKAYTEDTPLKGDHPYDVSKSSADLICQTYYKTYKTPVVITRFGNVYGEGDLHLDRIIPGICESVIKKKALEIRSDGTYIRDYIYVKDVVRGYITLLENFEEIKGEAFNFSSLESLSVLELIKRAEKILKIKVSYKILNNAKNEIPYQHLNDSKIKKMGWQQKFFLENTLYKIVDWYRIILK